jgi:hypothetical protein
MSQLDLLTKLQAQAEAKISSRKASGTSQDVRINRSSGNQPQTMSRFSSFEHGQELTSSSRPPIGYGPRRITVGARNEVNDRNSGSSGGSNGGNGGINNITGTTSQLNNNLLSSSGWDAPLPSATNNSSSWAMPTAIDTTSSGNIFGG